MSTTLTDKQFALDKAIEIYLLLYKEESAGVENILHKVDGYSTPNEKQFRGVLELANRFEQHLKA